MISKVLSRNIDALAELPGSLPENRSASREKTHLNRGLVRTGRLLLIAAWFAVFTGLIEGCGLILFQHVNWRNWPQMIHVSPPIIWISPVLDLLFFVAVALLIALLSTVVRRLPSFPILVLLLSFLAVYDWLTLTGRLYRISCVLLAAGVAVVFTRWAKQREPALTRFLQRTVWLLAVAWAIAFVSIHWGSRWEERREFAALPAASPGAPNVLVVVIDTLRADHLSSYGYARQTSPNIDRLAAEGVLFENAISPTPWSLPSHVSLVTGRYQFEHGIGDVPPMSVFGLRAPAMNGFPTLGEALRHHGYRTGAFSANLINFTSNLGFSRSFTHFEDFFQSPADAFVRTIYGREFARMYFNRTERSKVKRLLRWMGWTSVLDRSDEGSIRVFGVLGVEKRGATVNRELLRWIDSSRKDRPFFAFLNYMDVHHPYGGPPSFNRPWPSDSRIDRYDDGVRYVDACIGELMDQLRQRKLAANTIVVITSDHGEGLGDHGIAFHGESLYREQVHVPLILWSPGRIPMRVRVPELVSSASLPATMVSLLGLPPVKDFERPAIDAYWKNARVETEEAGIVSEVVQRYPSTDEDIASEKIVPVSMMGAMKALTTPHWKFMTHEKLGNQLYDTQKDPQEATNLYPSAQFQPVAASLVSSLQSLIGGSISRSAAMPLSNGSHDLPGGQVLYRVLGSPGSRISLELHSKAGKSSRYVLNLTGSDGVLLRDCKNPGDDSIPSPGVADSTPQRFDDLCVNSMSANAGSRLEILVPGKGVTPVELYLSVSDWDGHPLPESKISVTGAVSN